MGDMLIVVAVVALVVAVATYLTWIASRLDRLAVRVGSLWATLDGQLAARAFAAHELAHQLDDTELHAAARAAGAAEGDEREVAENRLSRALHAALPDGIDEAAERMPAVAVAAAGGPGSVGASGSSGAGRLPTGGPSLPVAARLPPRSTDDPMLAGLP